MCLSAIYWSHIDKIYYANTRDDAQNIDFDDSIIYSELQKNNKERKIPMIQMMREEALKAFEIWDKKVDKVKDIKKWNLLPYTLKWIELIIKMGTCIICNSLGW